MHWQVGSITMYNQLTRNSNSYLRFSFRASDEFSITSLLPAAARDAAADALHEEWRKWDGQVGENWTAKKFRDVIFLSWRNEHFRDVNFPSRTTESCPDVNRPSRTRRVVKTRIFRHKFILRTEVLSDESDFMSRAVGLKKWKKCENLKKPEKTSKNLKKAG